MNIVNWIISKLNLQQVIDDDEECIVARKYLRDHDSTPLLKYWYTIERSDIKVYISDLVLAATGIPRRIPSAIACVTDEGELVIIVNKKLLTLKRTVMDAIITHEEGHHVLGHIAKKMQNKFYWLKIWYDIKSEHEADVYAYEAGKQIIEALLWYDEIGLKHMDKRYNMMIDHISRA